MHSYMMEKKKHYLIEMKNDIFKKSDFCKGMLPIENEYSVCLRHSLCTL
jgi:hypothetical protein